jgi:hypothetical protein
MTDSERITALDAEIPAKAQRLLFDDVNHTITLDGVSHHVAEPKAYSVYKAIAQRPANMAYITKKNIRLGIKGVAGQKTIPNLIKTLPHSLRKTVRPCPSRGYCIELPLLNRQQYAK